MKRILFSTGIIIFTLIAVTAGGTGAFFSDTETSSGNTFTAGSIDLKIDNESYYNGAVSPDTSWSLTDLTIQKFFNFLDLKPGDVGEDTISVHVDNNDSYVCANVTLRSNDDNGLTEPESLVDQTGGVGEGELAQNVNFIWWADDGDNVLETGENLLPGGTLGMMPVGSSTTVTLADSATNIWSGTGPITGGETRYIGKAWCFGSMTPIPLEQDGLGSDSPRTPANSNGGISCDGSKLGNETQSDSLTADVSFTAVQARHNSKFLCNPPVERGNAKITVTKVVVNNNGGNESVSSFQLFVDDGVNTTGVVSGVQSNVLPGTYSIIESGVSGYQATFSGDCDATGQITLANNDVKSCTITNTELPAHITLIKNVTGDGTLASNTLFGLTVDGVQTPTGASVAVTSNAPHIINEVGRTGYSFVNITGNVKCPAVLGGTATLDEGEAITCTITNHKN